LPSNGSNKSYCKKVPHEKEDNLQLGGHRYRCYVNICPDVRAGKVVLLDQRENGGSPETLRMYLAKEHAVSVIAMLFFHAWCFLSAFHRHGHFSHD
jgi:hypothetical protein